MRVAIWMYAYLPKIGGAQISAHGLARGLVGLGHAAVVFADRGLIRECERRKWTFNYELKAVGRNMLRLPTRLGPIGASIAAAYLARMARAARVDVIQVIGLWPWAPLIGNVRRWSGLPVIVRAAGDDLQTDETIGYGVRRNRWIDTQIVSALGTADVAIAISETIRKEYLKVGVREERIALIPPGVDCAPFERNVIERRAIRERWGLPDDRILILAVGRNHPKKGFPDLIHALGLLNVERRAFAVAVVGRGSDGLRRDAIASGVEDEFFAIPEIGETDGTQIDSLPSEAMIQLYRAADYVVVPSYLEGYTHVPLEAMASSVPVIVTDAPGCRETVSPSEDGLLVPSKSPDGIAMAVRTLEADATLRSKLVAGGLRKARAQNWSAIASRHLELYETARARRRSGVAV